MCDYDTQKDADAYLEEHPDMSRRDFTKLATGASMAMMLPAVANAQSISERDVEIRTPDGVADCHFAYPSNGSHAAVLANVTIGQGKAGLAVVLLLLHDAIQPYQPIPGMGDCCQPQFKP